LLLDNVIFCSSPEKGEKSEEGKEEEKE